MQEINLKFEGFQDSKKDETCFYLKEKPQYLPPSENFDDFVNPAYPEDDIENENGNGIYFAVAAAGLYWCLTRIVKCKNMRLTQSLSLTRKHLINLSSKNKNFFSRYINFLIENVSFNNELKLTF